MRCFVTGATGVLGRALVPRLVGADHNVVAVARNPDAATRLREVGATPVAVDPFDPAALVGATEGSDAILHLATNVPPATKAARPSAWALHNRLRTEATANLLAAARENGIPRFVKESITFVYPDRGDDWIDETTPPDAAWASLAPTLEGERLALTHRDAVVLRFGLFYGGAGNRGTDEMLRAARFGRATLAGRSDAYVSSLHVDDAATAVLAALTGPTGVLNVVDDEPLPRGEHLAAFAAAFGTRRVRPVPGWMLRAVAGRAAAPLLASQRVSNRRFRERTGWEPGYPSAREGWAQSAETTRTGSEERAHA